MEEGKWYFDDEDSTVSVVENGIPLEVCTVCTFDEVDSRWVFGEKTKANAALLASAPALLDALEKAKEDINWMLNSRLFLNADVFNYIDVAIAAARGE